MAELPPKNLLVLTNWLAFRGLPMPEEDWLRSTQQAGYDGVQFIEPLAPARVEEAKQLGLYVCGSGRVWKPEDADRLAAEAQAAGLACLTLHVGTGLEDDGEIDQLVCAVLEASAKHGVPLYPETHRATIFQDMWRTVQAVRRFPDIRFNCDFSHWYTGLEMHYGDFHKKTEFLAPVFERAAFVHGRIGNPGCIQVNIDDGNPLQHPYVTHFRTFWTAAFAGFLRNGDGRRQICFVPELLDPSIYYARTFQGREECDRWQQSQVLTRLARECFEKAHRETMSETFSPGGRLRSSSC